MNVSILTLGRREHSARRRSNRCSIGVESMEGRALLASAAVTSAIYTVQQSQLDLHRQIDQEITFLKGNILSIQDATKSFIYNNRSDILTLKQDMITHPENAASDRKFIAEDRRNIQNATRDEKFAIGQQNQLARELDRLGKRADSTVRSGIRGLNRGTIDPANVQTIINNDTTAFQTALTSVDTRATNALRGLTTTFDSGTA